MEIELARHRHLSGRQHFLFFILLLDTCNASWFQVLFICLTFAFIPTFCNTYKEDRLLLMFPIFFLTNL
jgi:hypothetical protein